MQDRQKVRRESFSLVQEGVDFYFLPGFGSSSAEFGPLIEYLQIQNPRRLSPSMTDLRTQFAASSSRPRILMGYSLGGRMALSLLIDQAVEMDGLVLISTHPGLKMPTEIQSRLKSDEQWAKRFETESLDQVYKDWEAQVVFQNTTRKSAFSGSAPELAAIMRQWSLGKQKDYRPEVFASKIPQLWLFGANDSRFMEIYRRDFAALASANVQSEVVPNAGHRLHLDQPEVAGQKIQKWLKNRILGSF